MNVHITLLGGFAVTVDGVAGPRRRLEQAARVGAGQGAGPGAQPTAAPRPGHRRSCGPTRLAEAAVPRLHKAAHFARRALGTRRHRVGGAPQRRRGALARRRGRRRRRAVPRRGRVRRWLRGPPSGPPRRSSLYGGPLLPDDLYEPWTQEPRESLRLLHLELLRLAGRWEEVLQADPADEQAHLAIARRWADDGDQRAALRQFERLDQAVRRELGTTASPAAEELRGAVLAALSTGRPSRRHAEGRHAVGRPPRGRRPDPRPPGPGRPRPRRGAAGVRATRGGQVRGAGHGHGRWPGSAAGGSAVAPPRRSRAPGPTRRSWRRWPTSAASTPRCWTAWTTSSATRSTAPCPAGTSTWSGETAHQRLFLAAAELLRLAAAGHGLLLVVDDIHEADQGSLRLLHYLARCAVANRCCCCCPTARRPTTPRARSWTAWSPAASERCSSSTPLDQAATRRLLAHRFPSLDEETVQRIWAVSAGLPFSVLELGRGGGVRAAADGRRRAAAPGAADVPAGRPARHDVHHRRAARRGRGVGGPGLPSPRHRPGRPGRGAGPAGVPVPARPDP